MRLSRFIDYRQALNIQRAVAFAVRINRPLNTFVTLNFGHTACPEEQVSKLFEKLRDNHFSKWLRDSARRKERPEWLPACHVWAIEVKPNNPNAHWLLHMPTPLAREFEDKLQRWLKRLASPLTEGQKPLQVQVAYEATGAALYLLKGIDPRYGERLKIRAVPQGTVVGKRAGVSVSLSVAARARATVVKLGPLQTIARSTKRQPG